MIVLHNAKILAITMQVFMFFTMVLHKYDCGTIDTVSFVLLCVAI